MNKPVQRDMAIDTYESIVFCVNLNDLGLINLAHLKSWLQEEFDFAEHTEPETIPAGGNAGQDPASAAFFFYRCYLHLSRLLLELGCIPYFDLPNILAIKHKGEQSWQADIRFRNIGSLPALAYETVLKCSMNLCHWMARQPVNEHTREKVYAAIQTGVIDALSQIVPGGKSTIPVLRTAYALGIPYRHLGLGAYQLGWGSKARRMDRSICELDSIIGGKLSNDKAVAAALLRTAGLPSPVHAVVSKAEDAQAAAGRLGFPLVVKPSDRERGEGVTVDITDATALATAFEVAQKLAYSKQVIVERQVSGVCHRLFIANGKMLYAVKRLPMSVKGDGSKTIAQLVDAEVTTQRQLPPWKRTEIQPIDDLAIAAMKREGWSPESVPPKGVLIPLRRIESTAWGGIDEEVTDRIHAENLTVALRAAELFGLHIAGIDIISPDISRPWFENGAVINEVNFSPLFGGGEISRRYIPFFFKDFIDGDGRIPVETLEGIDAQKQAMQRQSEFMARGMRCFITSAAGTLDPQQRPVTMPFTRVNDCVRALLCRKDIDALLIITN